MLETRERGWPEMRAFVQEGLADLESGECEEFTDENLSELFDGVARRGSPRSKTTLGPDSPVCAKRWRRAGGVELRGGGGRCCFRFGVWAHCWY